METKMVHNVNQQKDKKSMFTEYRLPSCEDRWDHQQTPSLRRGFILEPNNPPNDGESHDIELTGAYVLNIQ